MKKIQKLILLLLMFSINYKSNATITQIIDMRTGVVNNTTSTMIVSGQPDDTWMVKFPGSPTFQTAYSTTFGWPTYGCGRWITPLCNAYAPTNSGPKWVPGGIYDYRMEFTPQYNCPIISAKIVFSYTNSDNQMDSLIVNNGNPGAYTFNYPLVGFPKPHFILPTWVPTTAYTVNLSPSTITSGVNTIDFFIHNAFDINPQNIQGFALCAQLEIIYDDVLVPVFTTASTICAGSQLIVNGSATNNPTITNNVWTVVESDQFGNPTPSAPVWWSPWSAGSPGYYAMPAYASGGPNLVCGKYYKVSLAVQNPCNNWAATSQVIYVNCLPTVNLGPDQTICEGTCVTLYSGGPIKKHTYVWSVLTDEPYIIGTGGSITVCPTSTTTYCVTGTNVATGCSATSCVTITVLKTKPDFTAVSSINPSDNFYTTVATPVNLAAAVASIPGFGYAWFVDEIVSPSNTTVISGSSVINSGCWWNPTLITNFNGYDGPFFTSTNGNPMIGGCGSPSVGHFTAGHTYRITRGTWSDYCPWQQYSVITYMGHAMAGSGSIIVQEDPNAPDYSYYLNSSVGSAISMENNFSVFPNPSNGIFSIQFSKAAIGTIEIYDAFGKKIQTIAILENTLDYKLDLSKYAKGIYMLNMITEGKKISKKIIVE